MQVQLLPKLEALIGTVEARPHEHLLFCTIQVRTALIFLLLLLFLSHDYEKHCISTL